MNVLKIYNKYQIMPQLQQHQLRVAGVAKVVCENFKLDIDADNIIKACLLHDLGNIVKFNFDQTKQFMPELAESENLEAWKKVKKKFISKYGPDSHIATGLMAEELGVGQRVRELVDCVGFEQGNDNSQSTDFGKKICAYSDIRVCPGGICSLEQRMGDLRLRYQNHPEGLTDRESFENSLRQIQAQIFMHCKIKPEDITPSAVAPHIESLKGLDIATVDKY
jgi:hypothetical protein